MDKITSKKAFTFIIPCPLHPGEQIVRACNDLSCSNQCLYCPQCEKLDKQHSSDHRTKIRPISELITYLCKELEKFTVEGKNVNTFLLEDMEKNLKTMTKHLKEQRNKIEIDFKKLIENLMQVLKQHMQDVLKNIDSQYEIFVRNYEIFKEIFKQYFLNDY